MKFRRILALLLTLMMLAGALSLSACDTGGTQTDGPTTAPSATTAPPSTDPADEGFAVTFSVDEHITVTVYPTQKGLTDDEGGTPAVTAVSRHDKTGAPLSDGTGQVNFRLTFAEGYELASLTVTPSDAYTNLKGSADTGVENGYRITKITAPLTVSATARPTSQGEDLTQGHAVTFAVGEHVSVTVYRTQDLTAAGEAHAAVAYSRDSATGALTKSGDGQVNFVLVFDEGYTLDSISVTPGSGFKNLKGPAEVGADDAYRVTKITAPLTVTVTAKPAP